MRTDPTTLDPLITRWVALCGTDAEARRILGVTKGTWSGYVTGRRVLPRYIARSIEAHLALAAARLPMPGTSNPTARHHTQRHAR